VSLCCKSKSPVRIVDLVVLRVPASEKMPDTTNVNGPHADSVVKTAFVLYALVIVVLKLVTIASVLELV